METKPQTLVPAPKAASECHVTRRSLGRWMKDERLNFPRPVEINKRLYFDRDELEAWKRSRVRPA